MRILKIMTLNLFTVLLLAATAMAQDPVPTYPDNYKVLAENDRVRVLDFGLAQFDGADLSAADLRDTQGLVRAQLATALSLTDSRLPTGLSAPE